MLSDPIDVLMPRSVARTYNIVQPPHSSLHPQQASHIVLKSFVGTLFRPLNSPFKLNPGPFVLLNTTS